MKIDFLEEDLYFLDENLLVPSKKEKYSRYPSVSLYHEERLFTMWSGRVERRSSWFLEVNSFNLSLAKPREGEKEEGRSGRFVSVRSRTSSTSSSFRGRATTISRKYIEIEVKRIVTIQLLDPLDPVMHRTTVGPFWEVVADFSQPLVSCSGRVLTRDRSLLVNCPFTPIPHTNSLYRAFPSRFSANENFYQVFDQCCCFTFCCSFSCSFVFRKFSMVFCDGYISRGIFLFPFFRSIVPLSRSMSIRYIM